MYVVITGGGKVGYYLAKTLLPFKHKVILIEENRDICKKIADELNIMVCNGDGTNIDILSEVGIEKADIFIAVTGKDEDNLISCQLAKRNFRVKRTIARVNNPKNIMVFERLGVDFAVSSTSLIADLIEQEVDYSGLKTLTKLKEGKIVISELFLNDHSPIIGKALKDIKIPGDCILISLIRDEEVIIPNGYTIMQAGDAIIAVSTLENQQALKDFFIG